MSDMLDLLHRRRSVVVRDMVPPGPDAGALEAILRAGLRVPDHGKLAPWRFIIFQGAARTAFGEVLRQAFVAQEPAAEEERIAFEAARFERAPVVVAVISKVTSDHKVPEWEQVLSAGAVCQNMLVAAAALGFAGQWLTEWYAYDPLVTAQLGLGEGERVAGFLYFGSAKETPQDRLRPDLEQITTEWRPAS